MLSGSDHAEALHEASVTTPAADVPDTPYDVYDIDGFLLFYLFRTQSPGESRPSWVRAAADQAVGPAILSVDTPRSPWDPAVSMDRASALASEQFEGTLGTPQLVCYSYPKIGVRIPVGDSDSVIYDAVSLARVPEREPGNESFGTWSFHQTVVEPQVAERQEIWKRDNNRMTELGPIAGPADVPAPAPPHVASRLIRYSPTCDSHDCFALYRQETEIFCTVACAQMILDFYRYNFSQNDIANQIGVQAGSPLPEDPAEKNAYEALSNGGLSATIQSPPIWDDAKAEIEANRPFRDGIVGHARVCTGWIEESDATTGQILARKLQLYDPWPENPDPCAGGQYVWERWETTTHTSFIYVRHP
jgi:hypothetical protein